MAHPENFTAGMFFPVNTGECEQICEEVSTCSGQAQATIVNQELTGTSCKVSEN